MDIMHLIIAILFILHIWMGGKMFGKRCMEHKWYRDCDEKWFKWRILKWMFLWPILKYVEIKKENK